MNEQTFTLTSDEGLPIRVTLTMPEEPRAVVIVVHGFKGFREWSFFPWISERLADCDFAVCRFDMSRNGIGEDLSTFEHLDLFADDTYSIQLADLRRVAQRIDEEPSLSRLPRFLLGHSRGGAVALLGAEDVSRIRGVITWSTISTADRWDEPLKQQWRSEGGLDVVNQRTGQVMRVSTAILDDYETNRDRLDVLAAAERLRVPLFAVHGLGDESVPAAESRIIAGKAADASLLLITGASHTFGAIHPLIHLPRDLELVMRATIAWVTGHSQRTVWQGSGVKG